VKELIMSKVEIAVLGGGYAGTLAARRLAAKLGPQARVTLLSARDHLLERIRLHQVAAGQEVRTVPLAHLQGGAWLEVATVQALDPVSRTIETSNGRLRPDFVVHALGSTAWVRLPGGEHALRLDGQDSARTVALACARAVEERRALAIIGAGLTAIELAAELADAHPGLPLFLYSRSTLGEGVLGQEAIDYIRAALLRLGVSLQEGAAVTAVEPDAIWIDGARQPVVAVVACTGFAASPLAALAELPTDHWGRMLTDACLCQRSHAWLWGAGDAATPAHAVGASLHMACKTALVTARHCADNLAAVVRGKDPTPLRFGDTGVCISLGRRDGIIQHRAPNGAPTGTTRGRAAALFKEQICRFTVRALRRPAWQRLLLSYEKRGATLVTGSPGAWCSGAS
jgi:NADH dehydrogenase FAD-containing subunit